MMIWKKLYILMICCLTLVLITGCGKAGTKQSAITTKPVAAEKQTVIRSETVQTPDSSAFSSIGYDADEGCLIVTFRDSGTTYYYPDFSYNEWLIFKSAESLGSYFNENIKPNYDYSKKIEGKKETKETTSGRKVTAAAIASSTSQKHDYVANKNTKKFHYDWCASVDQMKESNKKIYYDTTRDELISDGYKPCGNCNP